MTRDMLELLAMCGASCTGVLDHVDVWKFKLRTCDWDRYAVR